MSHFSGADPTLRAIAAAHPEETELAQEVAIEDNHASLLEQSATPSSTLSIQPVEQSINRLSPSLPLIQQIEQSGSRSSSRMSLVSLRPSLSQSSSLSNNRSTNPSPQPDYADDSSLTLPADQSSKQFLNISTDHDEKHESLSDSPFISQSNSQSNSRPGTPKQLDKATLRAIKEGEMLIKPTEMDQAELETHMAEMTSKIQNEQELLDQQDKLQDRSNQIVINPGKYDKQLKTVFGFTLHCKCTIIDEVRMTVWLLLIIGALCGIGFFFAKVDYNFDSSELKLHERSLALILGGVFSLLACILSFLQIRDHRRHWVHPPSQRCVIKILMMVPVYAVSAWMSLLFLRYSLYIDFVRLCYEALVIYQFMILLTKYLGGQAGVVEWLKTKSKLKWPTPLCCLPPVDPGARFMTAIKYGTLQYAVISPFVSVIAMALNTFDLYGDGVFDFTRGYVYVTIIQNFTQITSLYCLVWLYVVMKNELQPFSPMAKFLVVKSVVFFTFWQSIGLAVLVKLSVVTETSDLDVGEVQIGLQDFIICIEMFIAAAVHKYTFGVEKYKNGAMKLLMDERALYLAKLSYERAVEQQKKAREQALEEERAKAGLKKKKKKKRRSTNQSNNQSIGSVDNEHHIDIDSHPLTPVLDPTRFNNDDDEALVDSTRPDQSINPKFNVPRSMIQFSLGDPDHVELQPMSRPTNQSTYSSPFKSSSFKHAPPSFAKAMGKAAMTMAKTGKTLIAPVTKMSEMIGLIDKYDEALIDEDWDERRARPVMLTREQREEIEEQVRAEKEQHAIKQSIKRSIKQENKKKEALQHMQNALASQSSALDPSLNQHDDDDDEDDLKESMAHSNNHSIDQSSDDEYDSEHEMGYEACAGTRTNRSGHGLINQFDE